MGGDWMRAWDETPPPPPESHSHLKGSATGQRLLTILLTGPGQLGAWQELNKNL